MSTRKAGDGMSDDAEQPKEPAWLTRLAQVGHKRRLVASALGPAGVAGYVHVRRVEAGDAAAERLRAENGVVL